MDLYRLDILNYPTLPSLSFAVFRSSYLNDDQLIPIIVGPMFKKIKRAYYGGFVDIYRPYGNNVKSYDVNSLYPYLMATKPMPVGEPIHRSVGYDFPEDFFGFVNVKVTAPLHLRTPTLPHRFKGKSGQSTIYPVGTWQAWYFSEELKANLNLGYKYEIIEGYEFQKQIIFKEFIENLYDMKKSATPGSLSYIANKLLMNSQYGRYGMDPNLHVDEFVTPEKLNHLTMDPKIIILDTKDIGDKI
jgi:hypothetical protein